MPRVPHSLSARSRFAFRGWRQPRSLATASGAPATQRTAPFAVALLTLLVWLLACLFACPARAAAPPWSNASGAWGASDTRDAWDASDARDEAGQDASEDVLDDRIADGDLDEEDRAALRLGRHPATSDLHGASWVSLVGFERELLSGKNDVGGMVVVGLALDRIAAGDMHRVASGDMHRIADGSASSAPSPQLPASTWPDAARDAARDAAMERLLAPLLARKCVAAAWRTSGLGADDARIDALISRSRASALLPETRLRAMRLWDDAAHATTLATTDDTSYYDAVGANLVLELRLTWRLDRLLYAGDEPTLERVRLERQDARARVAARTLEALFAWQRATVASAAAETGSPEKTDAYLRAAEAAATLDVLTGGWFSSRDPQ